MKTAGPIEIVGWLSTAILLATIGRQVFSQWRSKSIGGVSKWLFVGQIGASIGFTIYSYLLHNWVFLVSNIAMIATAILGEAIYLSNRRRKSRSSSSLQPITNALNSPYDR